MIFSESVSCLFILISLSLEVHNFLNSSDMLYIGIIFWKSLPNFRHKIFFPIFSSESFTNSVSECIFIFFIMNLLHILKR